MGLLLAPVSQAAAVTGTVQNGTSGKPAAGIDVLLIQLQGGMQTVASTKTGPDGKYSLNNPSSGPMPMLIRAVYRGVFFHQPLTPGQSSVDVTVFEPSSDPKTLKYNTRVMMFQPNGDNLMVVEEYALQNNSQPPVAFYSASGNFQFALPDGAQEPQVASWGPSKMPVNQSTISQGKGKYAISYAFQPGDNGVRITYQVPYPSNKTTLKLVSTNGAERIGLIVPATLQVQGAGFTAQGQEQGYNLFSRDAIPAGTPFEVSVSGTAPPPSADGAGPEAGGGNAGPNNVAVQVIPNRLDSLKWLLLGGFVVLFGTGVLFIWRQPAAISAAGVATLSATSEIGDRKSARKKPAMAATPAPAPPNPATVAKAGAVPAQTATAGTGSSVSAVAREVELSLDGLKDRLFRLELRRQAGTLSEEDYVRERAEAEKVLRDLVGR
jgi:hypothetical protein